MQLCIKRRVETPASGKTRLIIYAKSGKLPCLDDDLSGHGLTQITSILGAKK